MKLFKVSYFIGNKIDHCFELGRTIAEVKWLIRRRFKHVVVISVRDWS